MAELTERRIKEQDIDWYCLIQGKPTHIASMGGMIPKQFRDTAELRRQQDMVAMMDPFVDVSLNMKNIRSQIEDGYGYLQDEMIRNEIIELNKNNPGFDYLRDYDLSVRLFASTFVEKARRGFHSFIRQDSAEGNEYILIAKPSESFTFYDEQMNLQELNCDVFGDGDGFVIADM